MSVNNSVNMSNFPYYFCLKMDSSHANVTGDGTTEYHVPYSRINDNWFLYDTGTNLLTLPVSGRWVMGMSVKISDNYADLYDMYFGATKTDCAAMTYEESPVAINSNLSGRQTVRIYNSMVGPYQSLYTISSGDQFKCLYRANQGVPALNAGLIADETYPTYWWGYLQSPDPYNF